MSIMLKDLKIDGFAGNGIFDTVKFVKLYCIIDTILFPVDISIWNPLSMLLY